MAQVAFPEPVKGETNPNVVLGTPADDQVATDVTGIALAPQGKGTCKRRCCWATGIVLSLLATVGIGILIGFFIFANENLGDEMNPKRVCGSYTLKVVIVVYR